MFFMCPKHTDDDPPLWFTAVGWSWQMLDWLRWFYPVLHCHKQRCAFFPMFMSFLCKCYKKDLTMCLQCFTRTQPSSCSCSACITWTGEGSWFGYEGNDARPRGGFNGGIKVNGWCLVNKRPFAARFGGSRAGSLLAAFAGPTLSPAGFLVILYLRSKGCYRQFGRALHDAGFMVASRQIYLEARGSVPSAYDLCLLKTHPECCKATWPLPATLVFFIIYDHGCQFIKKSQPMLLLFNHLRVFLPDAVIKP